ncbi:hypothetical protein MRX96_044095 [Rhipicephalus microplus]
MCFQVHSCSNNSRFESSRHPCFSSSSRRVRTCLTRAHPCRTPARAYPTWSEHLAMGDHGKDNSQTVPTLGNSPPLCYTISDEDSSNGDVAQQTTMHQELPRWEESRLSMRVMSLEMNNTGSHQYSSEQARGMRAVSRPRAKPPLSPIDSSDEKSAKLDAKRWRNRIAQAKCRQRRIDLDTFLEQKLRKLKLETDTLAAAANSERYQVELLRQRWAMHAKFCGVT